MDVKELHKQVESEYLPSWRKIWDKQKRVHLLLEMVASEADETSVILDIGCREGLITNAIYNATKAEVHGIDFVEQFVSEATLDFPHVYFQVMNAESLRIEDKSIDIVAAGEIIEHLIEPHSFLKEVWRVLKPNGTFVLSTPNHASLRRRVKLMFGMNTDYDSVHFHTYNYTQLHEILEKNGFEIMEFKGDGKITKFSNIFIVKCKKVEKNEDI